MPAAKLKNLVIVILLLADLALLCILIPRQQREQQEAEQLRRSLDALCAAQNIRLEAAEIPETVPLYALELADWEQAQADALKTLSGSTAAKWTDGSLQLKLSGQKEVSDLTRSARRTLRSAGFDIDTVTEPVRQKPGVHTLTATQSILGVPIFSDGLTLTYGNHALISMEGSFYTGTPTRTGDELCIDAADAVLAFLADRLELGWVGSRILTVQQGYMHLLPASGLRLTPVWKLSTDMGNYCVNGLNKEVFACP